MRIVVHFDSSKTVHLPSRQGHDKHLNECLRSLHTWYSQICDTKHQNEKCQPFKFVVFLTHFSLIKKNLPYSSKGRCSPPKHFLAGRVSQVVDVVIRMVIIGGFMTITTFICLTAPCQSACLTPGMAVALHRKNLSRFAIQR